MGGRRDRSQRESVSEQRTARTKEDVPTSTAGVLRLQRTIGNQAVYRLATGGVLQAALQVGPADDHYEREADQIADAVMRDLDTTVTVDDDAERVRRSVAASVGWEGGPLDGDTEGDIQRHRGQGTALPASLRQSMEGSFAADFSHVRVHTGPSADELNRSVQSRAFTVGSDIFFARGEYQPQSTSGQRLLAHELTHTIQQGAASSSAGHSEDVVDESLRRSVARVAQTGGTVVQRAGHKDAWCFSKDKRYVIKITADAEEDIYQNAAALGIAGVIPGRIATLAQYAQIANYDPERTLRQPKPGESIIVIENLAPKGTKFDQAPLIFDAKIGFHTASGTQAAQEGFTLPGFKAFRHDIIDIVMTSSREQGYRFEEGQEEIDKIKKFAKSGKPSDLAPLSIDPFDLAEAFFHIIRDLRQIHLQMSRASVTFIGSSALMIIFPSRPEQSKARMIDFAHPLKQTNEPPDRFEKYRQNYVEGIANLILAMSEIAGALESVTVESQVPSGSAEQAYEML